MKAQPKIHTLHCQEPWFSLLYTGVKPVEGRKRSSQYESIRPGDLIDFQNDGKEFRALVTEVRLYESLQEYLQDVGVEVALPGVSSMDEAVRIYSQWSTKEELARGFVGIFVERVLPI